MKKYIYHLFALLLLSSIGFSQNCVVTDYPDPLYADINEDGIDGDILNAVFVSEIDGLDSNPGTIDLPVKTIQQGIDIATVESKDVYVAMGTYNVSTSLMIEPGVNLFGKFSGLPSWSRSEENETIINGQELTVLAVDIDIETRIEGFTISSADASLPGQSSYAVLIINCSQNVILRHNIISSGNGGDGLDGLSGFAGQPGMSGSPGTSGVCNGTPAGTGGSGGLSLCGMNGGAGGNGGAMGPNAGMNGQEGVGGTAFGNGGNFGDPGQAGQAGQAGNDGSDGMNGALTAAVISFDGNGYFIPSNGYDGSSGNNGNGGGGGGGGGAQSCTFCGPGSGNGGAGGGGGGCAGGAGAGGTGGGGSFAVVVLNSNAIIERNQISSSVGGKGANGGDGGQGGDGGPGGTTPYLCPGEIGAGGAGGAGGKGGNGGAGSGGLGGHSVGIYISENSFVQAENNVFDAMSAVAGAGGVGGIVAGGGFSAPNGPDGILADIYGNVASFEVFNPSICLNDNSADEPLPESTSYAEFKIYLSGPSSQDVTVDYATQDGTAVEGTNYMNTSGTLTFLPDETVKSVFVEILSDLLLQGDVVFYLNLSNPVNSGLEFSQSVCTISDNELTGINQTLFESGFRIFPNPVSDYVLVESEHFPFSLSVYNSLGQVVFSQSDIRENFKIDAQQLPEGIYTIVVNVNELNSSEKLVVNRQF
jgi:hypothetical protein